MALQVNLRMRILEQTSMISCFSGAGNLESQEDNDVQTVSSTTDKTTTRIGIQCRRAPEIARGRPLTEHNKESG